MEFDDQEWDKREWVKVYEDFQLFLLEHQLVWAKRKECAAAAAAAGGGAGGLLQGSKAKHIQWPALVRPVFAIYRLGTIMMPSGLCCKCSVLSAALWIVSVLLHEGVAVYELFYKLVWLLLLFGWHVMLFLSIISELMKF